MMRTVALFLVFLQALVCRGPLAAENHALAQVPAAGIATAGPAPYFKPTTNDYDYYVSGNPGDAKTTPFWGLLLSGGGKDLDRAIAWLAKKANGGDFLVIRCSGDGAYNDYILGLAPLDSVETLVLKNRSASYDPFVLSKIKSAEAIFFPGGDQSAYLARWNDTPLSKEIDTLLQNGTPAGGTSAGLAVMGQFIYSAERGSVYSDEMLRDPYGERASLKKDFLTIPLLGNVITDTHFRQRDRMGRLTGFLARISRDGWSTAPRGIGVDEQTAVLIEPDAKGYVVGKGKAYFLQTKSRPQVCQPQTPLTYENIGVFCGGEGAVFDFNSWHGVAGDYFSVSAKDGILSPSVPYY